MLDTICDFWNEVKDKDWFGWLVIILAVVLYCNLGWALGYALCNPGDVPSWLLFLLDPLGLFETPSVYDFESQGIAVFLCPILWITEWVCYLVTLCFGGIAKLLIIP
jgi:hypothetical protein